MKLSNVSKASEYRAIEQLADGHWVIRYGAVSVGSNAFGEELLTFGMSEYPCCPTLPQILRSISRYAEAYKDDERITRSLSLINLADYRL